MVLSVRGFRSDKPVFFPSPSLLPANIRQHTIERVFAIYQAASDPGGEWFGSGGCDSLDDKELGFRRQMSGLGQYVAQSFRVHIPYGRGGFVREARLVVGRMLYPMGPSVVIFIDIRDVQVPRHAVRSWQVAAEP